ncbi:ABC transporter ATP-binding protein [Iningainema tapete]|uniref:ABC transporter ATP-binding protein n=1 Tax=Iningainema tapete BLCC-T55 TaxID=2748662 RepID=A0A8J7BWT2_9CYAN|nr:ABC transporter ATP-binding protein [Iningainema tapete]MBD2772397.1 ABC transporter ATP-binding protein [Iningainema tapete BLCC-T55]
MINSQVVDIFIKLMKPQQSLAIKALFLSCIVSFLEVVSTSLIMPFVQVLGSNKLATEKLPIFGKYLTTFYNTVPVRWQLLVITITFLIIISIKNIAQYFSNIKINDLQLIVGRTIRQNCVERFLELEFTYYSSSNLGKLLSYVNEQAQRSEYLSSSFIEIARELLVIFALLFLLINLSPTLTIFTTLSLLLVLLSLKFVIEKLHIYSYKAAKAIEDFSTFVTDMIRGIRVVKSFGLEQIKLEFAQQSLQNRYEAEMSAYKYNSAVAPLSESTGIAVLLLLLFVGSSLLPHSEGTALPLLLTYTLTLLRMLPRINHLNSLRSQLALLSGSVESIYSFLSSTSGLNLPNGSQVYSKLSSGIALENVTFQYSANSEPTLKNVTFQIKRGTTTAIVGSSGSGKSTLVDLVMRFHDANSGYIKVDGVELREFQISSWRSAIAMVSQDTFLFNSSVRENIAYGCPGATDLEIIEAAKKAYAYEFIQELPEKFDTIVGDSGTRLSGGQRQRIAIARAIIRNPDILILDEATSALDSNSERIVQKAIEEVSRSRTVITIAHRLSTIERADNIVILHNGCVVEQGTHQQLLSHRGTYWSLYQAQSSLHQASYAQLL